MLILLPPSEGKAPGGEMPAVGDPKEMEETRGVLNYETRLKASERRRFYGAKNDDKAREAHALNVEAMSAPCLPALERYTGVVYQNLDYASLSNKRAARARILIVSGLFGLIAGGVRIPRYKMPINGWLARYWRDINAARLAGARGRKTVLSLLPQSYAKALAADELIQVNFLVQGGAKSAGHFGKAIKGKFVRYLVANKVTNPKDFSGFREDGFQFDGENFVQG